MADAVMTDAGPVEKEEQAEADTLAIVPIGQDLSLADSREVGPLWRTAGGRSCALRAGTIVSARDLSCRLGALLLPVFDGRFLQAGWQVVRLGKASLSGCAITPPGGTTTSWTPRPTGCINCSRVPKTPCWASSRSGLAIPLSQLGLEALPGVHHVQGHLQAHSRA